MALIRREAGCRSFAGVIVAVPLILLIAVWWGILRCVFLRRKRVMG